MAILPDDIQNIEKKDVSEKIKTIYDYIVYIKEQLEFWASNKIKTITAALATLELKIGTVEADMMEVKTKVLVNATTDESSFIYTDLYTSQGQYIVGISTNTKTADELVPCVCNYYSHSNALAEYGRWIVKATVHNELVGSGKKYDQLKIYYLQKKGA